MTINSELNYCRRCYQTKIDERFRNDRSGPRGLTRMCVNCIKVHHEMHESIAQYIKDKNILLHKGQIVANVDSIEKAQKYKESNKIDLDIVDSVKGLFKPKNIKYKPLNSKYGY